MWNNKCITYVHIIYIYGVIKVNPQSLGGLRIKRIADYARTLRSVSGSRVKVKTPRALESC